MDIDEYPAVKDYLLSFGKERLGQTGKTHNVDGKIIKSRKKTNNKWFETQDSIGYWEDFSKQKIVYPETTQGAYFMIDKNAMMLDKTCFMILSDNLEYLIATLSSSLFEFAYKRIFSSIELGTNAYQYNKHALIKLPIRKIENESEYITLINQILISKSNNDNSIANEQKLNKLIYKLYNLNESEIEFIENLYV